MKYIALLIGISVLLSGCGGGEDTKSPIEPQQKQDLSAVNDILAQVKIKRSAIESAQEKVKEKADDAGALAGQIGAINLSDPNTVITSNESLQFNTLQNIQADMQKKANVSAEKAELKELLRKALDEQKNQPDSLLLRKVVDEIRDEIDAALASTKTINQLSSTTANLNPSIKNELDRAVASIGKSGYDVIDGILTDIQSAASLGELKNKISSVENQVRADSFVGSDIIRLFDQEIPKDIQGDSVANFKGIKDKAQEKLAEVDQYFAGVAADDAELLDKAKKLDVLLGNAAQKPLEKLADTKGFTSAAMVRKQKFKDTVDPGPTAGVPPPPGGGGVPPLPGAAATSLVKVLTGLPAKIAAAKAGQVETSLDALQGFYDTANIQLLKDQVKKAESNEATKEKLLDALHPFLATTIKSKLDATINEADFEVVLNDVANGLEQGFSDNLKNAVFSKRKERLDELRQHVDKNQDIKDVNSAVEDLDNALKSIKIGPTALSTLEDKCDDIKDILIGAPTDCNKLRTDTEADINNPPAGSSPIYPKMQFEKAVKELIEDYSKAYELIKDATNEQEFMSAIKELNKTIKNKFDVTTFPSAKSYTLGDLRAIVNDTLTNKNIPVFNVTYNAIIMGYKAVVDALPAVHDPAQVIVIKDNFTKTTLPTLPEQKLLKVLSSSGAQKVKAPFIPLQAYDLLAKAKDAALKGGSTNLSPEDLLKQINNMAALNDETAINNLLDRVARDLAPALKQKIIAIKLLPAIQQTFAEQQAKLKDLVDKDGKYLALKNLAALDVSDANAIKIIGPAPSLEDFASKIPRGGMRQDIFGKAAPSKIDVAAKFEELRDNYVANAVNRIKYNTDPKATGAPTKATTQPIVNALTLLFGYQLDELSKLNFDGSDDAQVEKILINMDSLGLGRFNGFYTAVGEDELDDTGASTGVKRPIISQLQALKAKLDGATSTNQMVTKLKTYIDAMMR